jgi:hypothetical protein
VPKGKPLFKEDPGSQYNYATPWNGPSRFRYRRRKWLGTEKIYMAKAQWEADAKDRLITLLRGKYG